MKTLLRSLLLTITVLIHFPGLNSSGIYGEGSSRQRSRSHSPPLINFEENSPPGSRSRSRSRSRSPPPLSQLEQHYLHGPNWRTDNQFVFFVETRDSPGSHSHSHRLSSSNLEKIVIDFMGKNLQMSYVRSRGRIVPIECKIISPHVGVPTLEYRKHHNYFTRGVYINDLRCVVYIEGNSEPLGAKLPPTADTNYPQDDPSLLNPDHTTWFVTYEGLDYEVTEEHVSGEELDVKLVRGDLRPNDEYIRSHGIKIEPIYFAGLFFVRYRRNDNVIVGADLDINWHLRPEYTFLL